jgi:hypothetical protein
MGQLIGLNNLVDNRRGRMTKPEMPLIQRNLFTNEGSKRNGSLGTRGWPWIETEFTRALKEELTSSKVLKIETSRMEFKKNMVIACELIN